MVEVQSVYGNKVRVSGDMDSITLGIKMEESQVAVILSPGAALELGKALVIHAENRIKARKGIPPAVDTRPWEL